MNLPCPTQVDRCRRDLRSRARAAASIGVPFTKRPRVRSVGTLTPDRARKRFETRGGEKRREEERRERERERVSSARCGVVWSSRGARVPFGERRSASQRGAESCERAMRLRKIMSPRRRRVAAVTVRNIRGSDATKYRFAPSPL